MWDVEYRPLLLTQPSFECTLAVGPTTPGVNCHFIREQLGPRVAGHYHHCAISGPGVVRSLREQLRLPPCTCEPCSSLCLSPLARGDQAAGAHSRTIPSNRRVEGVVDLQHEHRDEDHREQHHVLLRDGRDRLCDAVKSVLLVAVPQDLPQPIVLTVSSEVWQYLHSRA